MRDTDVRISDLATKRDLERFATKQDLERYATKENLNKLEERMSHKFGQVVEELDTLHGKVDVLGDDMAIIKGKLDILLNGSKPH